jgi:hypothetical protein
VKLTPEALSNVPPPIPPAPQAQPPVPPKPEPPPTVKLTPQALSNVPPPVPPTPPVPEIKSPDPKPPVKLMSSGQFAPPKPPEPAQTAPAPTPVASTPVAAPPKTVSTQTMRPPEPHTTGQQPPVTPPPTQPPPTQPPQKPPAPPTNWRRPLILGALLGAIVAIVGIALIVNQARKRNALKQEVATTVDVEFATNPPNASIRVNGDTKCTSPCKTPLAPGTYQVMAFLDGYDPATSSVDVAVGQPAVVNLSLAAQAQTVRILSDLEGAKITVDDQPAADMQEGQFIIDKATPGAHIVKVAGKNGTDATFTFEIAEAKPPAITGTVTTHNLVAVLVSSFGAHARVVTNSGPMKLAVNGQPEGDAGPAGVDLKTFQPGVDELIVGDGANARNMKESFGPQPMLTAFLKSDLNIGTLIVSTGEDDVKVFLNNKEYRRKTQRGQLRIPTIGQVAVRVEKQGFDGGAPQTAEIKKGAEVRLEFKMKALPQTATLTITGGTPGSEVLIDGKSVGTVGPDGSLNASGIAPGDHQVEIRRDQFAPKRFTRNFRAGQPTAVAGADAALASAATTGIIRITRNPADTRVTYRKSDDPNPKEMSGPQIELAPGSYVFYGQAPGYTTRTERVLIGAGETRTIELALTRAAAPTPTLKPGDITGFEDAGAWKREGELWTHRGGGFIPYGMGPKGIYTFTVELIHGGNLFKGGRIRWAIQYLDSKNYLLYELDRKNFWAEVVEKGKKLERAKTQHDLEKQKAFTIQIELTADHVVHKIKNASGEWITLDAFSEPGRQFTSGKFGFLIQGNDEIVISDFSFQPK